MPQETYCFGEKPQKIKKPKVIKSALKKISKPKKEKNITKIEKLIIKQNLLDKKMPYENEFILANGSRISTLRDLLVRLPNMQDSDFFNHLNENKNDFAAWIEGVFKDQKLAKAISSKKTKEELITFLTTLKS